MLYYISIDDFPERKASSIQQIRMCQAFLRTGMDVSLVHPTSELTKRPEWADIAEFYGLDSEFDIYSLPTLQSRFQAVPQAGLLSMMGTMTAWLVSHALVGGIDSDDIVYGRNYYGLFLFNELRRVLPASHRPTLIFEVHSPISARLKPRFFQSVDGIVTLTYKLRKYLVDIYGLKNSRVLVEPDGVDRTQYQPISETTESVRSDLGLPVNDDLVMYTGHLYEGKGVETLVAAAKDLNMPVYIVGGYEEDIQRVKSTAGHPDNVVFTGFVEPSEVPRYQVAADVLVAPYAADSWSWVSPLKLFEYMAAGRPIVASDREVLREVLTDGENALLFSCDDSDALRRAIEQVLDSDELANRLVAGAHETVEKHSWERRAERILDWVGHG